MASSSLSSSSFGRYLTERHLTQRLTDSTTSLPALPESLFYPEMPSSSAQFFLPDMMPSSSYASFVDNLTQRPTYLSSYEAQSLASSITPKMAPTSNTSMPDHLTKLPLASSMPLTGVTPEPKMTQSGNI